MLASRRWLRPLIGSRALTVLPVLTNKLDRSAFCRNASRLCRKTAREVWSRSLSSNADIELSQETTQIPKTCPGCGIRLQTSDPKKPGFFRIPTRTDKRASQSAQTEDLEESSVEDEDPKEEFLFVCERCFSLKNYGKIKNEEAELFVPKFSIEGVLKPKIQKNKGKKVVIVCVVDLFDFDASLPIEELKSLFPFTSRLPDHLDLILVANKIDLIPKSISRATLEIWLRTRLKEKGLPLCKTVYLISSRTKTGVRDLMIGLRKETVRNTDCYIIGMQNAGKSTMINALQSLVDDKATGPVTAAFLPGTTLGFVQIPRFPVPKTCRVFDTPGIESHRQIAPRLSVEELKLVQPRKTLKPRTYRFGPENSLLVGGLVRIDLISCPGRTAYLTVWVSEEIRCFLGKTEGIEEKRLKHLGGLLQPPSQPPRDDVGRAELIAQSVAVDGESWKGSSVDISIGGFGWIGIGVKGRAEFDVWTPKRLGISTRPSLIKEFASIFQRPGFSDTAKSRGVAS